MYKKFLLAAAGILATNAALIADTQTDLGVSLGYKNTDFSVTGKDANDSSFELRYKGLKNLMINLHSSALINDQFYIGAKAGFGMKMGKITLKPSQSLIDSLNAIAQQNNLPQTAEELRNAKVKGANSFEADLRIGYKFAFNDSFGIMPVVGYEYEKISHKLSGELDDVNLGLKRHSPYVGIELHLNPSEDFQMKAGFNYGFAGKLGKEKVKPMKYILGLGYNMDDQNSIEIEASYSACKTKKFSTELFNQDIDNFKIKHKSYQISAGYTYSF